MNVVFIILVAPPRVALEVAPGPAVVRLALLLQALGVVLAPILPPLLVERLRESPLLPPLVLRPLVLARPISPLAVALVLGDARLDLARCVLRDVRRR